MVSTCCITMQSLGKLGRADGHVSPLGCAKFHLSFKFDVIRAGCSAKSRCLYVFCLLFCHAPRPARCSFKRDILSTGVVSRFMGRF